MNKRRLAALAAVLLAVFAWDLHSRHSGHNTPAGQLPLQQLQSLEPLEQQFNAASGHVRVLVLLSPT